MCRKKMGITEAKVRKIFKKEGMANRLTNDTERSDKIQTKGKTIKFDKKETASDLNKNHFSGLVGINLAEIA